MTNEEIKKLCENKERELLDKYFGNLVQDAVDCTETIGQYTKDLPLTIGTEYQTFLEGVWKNHAPEELKNTPMVLEETKLRKLMTEGEFERVDVAYKDALEQTLWERITKTNHEDVTYYKGLLKDYTRNLLWLMRMDFLEEITNEHIKNKAFEE